MNKEIDVEGLKQVQLDILRAVHVFCKNNGINYSLSSGTLIGAIRHKGFIPWDDDIDICLLREDYEKLEAAFPAILEGKYQFFSLKRNKKWNRPWGKIQDSRTILHEDANYIIDGLGIGIDVFPMDDVPDNHDTFLKWNKKRKVLFLAWSIKQLRWSKERNLLNNVLMLFVRLLLLPFNLRTLAFFVDKYIKKTDGKGYNKVYESCDALKALNYQEKSNFDSYIDVEFEGEQFKAMIGYDNCLRNIYGDYMKLPPKEKQVSHHSFKAYWKK